MAPDLSVVLVMRNEGEFVADAMEGILALCDERSEVVIVDDGSTDSTLKVLRNFQKMDQRVRVYTQEKQGITKGLTRGCEKARGTLIARSDARDRSFNDRFRKQREVLIKKNEVAFVSSWVRYEGPDGEFIDDIRPDPDRANDGLQITSEKQKRVAGPYHGSTMFRRLDYESVGGYREQFYFAQDVDLWLRLHELGSHQIVPEVLYGTRLDPDSISGRCRAEQDRCLELAVEAARARRAGRSEAPYLAEAGRIRPPSEAVESPAAARRRRAGSLYFMGCMLTGESPGAAARYFRKSLGVDPFQPKAWLRLVHSGWRGARKAARSQ